MRHEERRLRRFVSFMELHKPLHHKQTGAKVGDGANRCTTLHVGRTPDVRACFRAVLHRRGSANGSSSDWSYTYRPKRATPYLYSEKRFEADGRRPVAAPSGGLRA